METQKKIHVGLLFGGNSSEHDVSKRSAHNIYDAMDKTKYDIDLFLLTKDGIVLSDAATRRVFAGEPEDDVVATEMPKLDMSDPLAPIKNLALAKDIDIFYPVVHGNLGEDGTLQGLFKLLKKPYVGSGVLASAASFDKDITKQILTHHHIQNTKYVVVTPENRDQMTYDYLREKVGAHLFIKPANQGSSVGIHKAENEQEYVDGLDDAFKYDYKILVEESIDNPREVECSILGNEDAKASKLGAIDVPKSDTFYDYNNKFVDASGVSFELPVELPADLTKRIQDMSLAAFKALGLKGMARVDFLVSEDGEPYLGEINTLPGFTNISLYPKLWEVSGISYTDLIDQLIQLGFDEFKHQSEIHYDFVALDAE
ncbi:D-alanine--D-alanine ligase family protein [Lactiplantibacillus xiangfangensis]|uniref:D-alanine--D-alanine ligase n=1 Tax=Lactiplantibacillus xiangfangensis TaxID=942150 RepID=A0A0R2M1V9_9LACO|nr:D-alanine--D-alanine ligase family protein [Lactiplantibacillus xiangfangensis]KRO07495.1 d-alanine--d-alanine ligase [Lactiplantibacillus xiangfangensis]